MILFEVRAARDGVEKACVPIIITQSSDTTKLLVFETEMRLKLRTFPNVDEFTVHLYGS